MGSQRDVLAVRAAELKETLGQTEAAKAQAERERDQSVEKATRDVAAAQAKMQDVAQLAQTEAAKAKEERAEATARATAAEQATREATAAQACG